ncbi:MAG: gamma-glutamylcyclotransferase [Pseudomonadota bacterium]
MTTNELWVFGYGSLIWNPEFPYVEREIADLHGFARRFCMLSIHHRGTPENPGLVLALDHAEQHSCRGVAFRLPEQDQALHLERLRERELVSSAYIESPQTLRLQSGRSVQALCYIVDREHEQYVRAHDLEEQAARIARSVGGRGPNPDYLHQTVQSLRDLDIKDDELEWLDAEVRRLTKAG